MDSIQPAGERSNPVTVAAGIIKSDIDSRLKDIEDTAFGSESRPQRYSSLRDTLFNNRRSLENTTRLLVNPFIRVIKGKESEEARAIVGLLDQFGEQKRDELDGKGLRPWQRDAIVREESGIYLLEIMEVLGDNAPVVRDDGPTTWSGIRYKRLHDTRPPRENPVLRYIEQQFNLTEEEMRGVSLLDREGYWGVVKSKKFNSKLKNYFDVLYDVVGSELGDQISPFSTWIARMHRNTGDQTPGNDEALFDLYQMVAYHPNIDAETFRKFGMGDRSGKDGGVQWLGSVVDVLSPRDMIKLLGFALDRGVQGDNLIDFCKSLFEAKDVIKKTGSRDFTKGLLNAMSYLDPGTDITSFLRYGVTSVKKFISANGIEDVTHLVDVYKELEQRLHPGLREDVERELHGRLESRGFDPGRIDLEIQHEVNNRLNNEIGALYSN